MKPLEDFKAVIDFTGNPVFVKDEQFRFVFLNVAACEMFGVSLEQSLGKTDYDIFPHEQADVFRAHDIHTLGTGMTDTNEELITDARGEVRTIVTEKKRYTDKGGEKYIIGTIRDITEYKKAKKALLESETKYRTLTESSLVGVYIVQDNLFRFVNKRWCEIFGYEFDEVVGKLGPKDLSPPEYGELIEENYRKRISGEIKGIEYELKSIRKDGTTIALKIFGSSMLYQGRPAISGTLYDITEYKTIEEALRTSQFRLTEAMNLAHIVYWEYDHEAKSFIFNDPFYTLYGTTMDREDGYRMSIDEYVKRFIHPEDMPSFSQYMNCLKSNPECMADLEFRIIRRDGDIRHILARSQVITDTFGRVITIYGADQDITERKKMEETVLESERNYRLLADNATDVIFIFDLDLKYRYVSPSVKKIRGYSPEEIIGQPVSGSITHESMEYIKKVLQEEMESDKTGTSDPERSRVAEVEMIRKDGSTLWTEIKASALRNDHGKPIGVMGIARDITKRKLAEEALQESELRFRNLVEMLPEVVFEVDLNAKITYANRRVSDVFGYSSKDIETGLGSLELLVPEDRERSLKRFAQRKMGEGIGASEYTMLRKDGSTFPALLHLSPKMKGNVLVGFRGILIDITEHKRVEEEKKLSEKLSAALEMAGTVCHEFNQPLQVIIGYTELLSNECTDDRTKKMLGHISDQARRMGAITKKLMGLQQYSTRNYVGSTRIVDINAQSDKK